MEELVYPKGKVVFFEGETGDCIYDIVSGSVGVYSAYNTDEETFLTELKPGQLFGEMALLEKAPRSLTIVSSSDDTVLRRINAEQVFDSLKSDPELVRRVMKHLSDRLRSLTNDYMEVMNTIKEIEDSKKLGIVRSDGLVSKIKFYVRMAAFSRKLADSDSLEKIWGQRNRREDRNATVRGRTPCNKKQPIFREGDEGDCMYYVYLGSVGIYSDFGGINEKHLTTVEECGFFGEMGMIAHMPRSATAIAETNNTYVEQIFEEDIDVLVEKTPDFVLDILIHLSMRLRDMTNNYFEACRKVAALE